MINCIVIYDENKTILNIKYFFIKFYLKKKKFYELINIEINNINDFKKYNKYFNNNTIIKKKIFVVIKININDILIFNFINTILDFFNCNKILILLINNIKNLNIIKKKYLIILNKKTINTSLIILKFFCNYKNIIFNKKIINIFKICKCNLNKTIDFINNKNNIIHSIFLQNIWKSIINNDFYKTTLYIYKIQNYFLIYQYIKKKILYYIENIYNNNTYNNINLIKKKIFIKKNFLEIINLINKIEILSKFQNKISINNIYELIIIIKENLCTN